MEVADLASSGAGGLDGRSDRASGRAPGYDKQVACGIAFGQNIGNVLNNGCHLSRTDAHHVFVVEGLVVHVAGTVLFLQAANAVLESGGAGERPGTGERLGHTLVRHKTDGSCREWDRNSRDVLSLGTAPS